MLKSVSSKNDRIFAPHGNHFIILLLTLFTLLFVFTTYIFWDQLYIALQGKFVVPQMEKKFGFRGKKEKIKYGGKYEYEVFSVESVEPGSLFAQAGFKPGDVPQFYGCRFFVNGKTNEAMFYAQLNSIRDENISVFSVTNIDDYRKYLKVDGAAALTERRVYLTTNYPECFSPQ
jgi:hypothetical protein